MEGDAWKYGEAPELPVLQRHKAISSRLLMQLPNYAVPIEGYVAEISPNGDFIYVSCSYGMAGWVPREEMRILDILPKQLKQH